MEEEALDVSTEFANFIKQYKRRGEKDFYYRSQLLDNYLKHNSFIEVALDDVAKYNQRLAKKIKTNPFKTVSLLEKSCQMIIEEAFPEESNEAFECQVLLTSSKERKSLRAIFAENIYKLVTLSGIAISVSSCKPRPVRLAYLCRKCRKRSKLKPGEPKMCSDLDCSSRDLVIIPDEGYFIDQQYIKLQESPEEVPTGEIPRTLTILCERCLIDRITPGARCVITGVQTVFSATKSKVQGKKLAEVNGCVIHALGVELQDCNRECYVTQGDEAAFKEFAKTPNVHDIIFKSIAPQIAGSYTKDIKKAIACLLFGGSERFLDDGTKLRGDINVLLIGDPSTAKSQFLKFTQKVAPIGVYTSGKGSSAAGLTAAVLRDAKGEFYVEAGAMVCADGGVVCIDEFDKMRDQDRVAIHEAMEQQTISIAKAGITTQLNSRTSVLAAANPVFGTYDDFKTSAENINFLPTILSRFDLIFIVKDVRNAQRDSSLASHILQLHSGNQVRGNRKRKLKGFSNAPKQKKTTDDDTVSVEFLKKYISYCRTNCKPVLSEEAVELLTNTYVTTRAEAQAEQQLNSKPNGTLPVTVRQLEAMARLCEALAKMQLKEEVQTSHVHEAIRLFKVCAIASHETLQANSSTRFGNTEEVQNIEAFLKSMLPIGSKAQRKKIMGELVRKRGYTKASVHKAFQVLIARGELKLIFQNKYVQRVC